MLLATSWFDGDLSTIGVVLLVLSLLIAFGFEFINGFHDTANAVATVIYTNSLKPVYAVVWSGLWNFIGVMAGGIAVAFSIVHLLPVELLVNIGPTAGIMMVLALLITAIIWNFGTWYLGLPASSSHTLIGAILGVGLASSLYTGHGFGAGVNWYKARDVMLSLLISPMIGFCAAGMLLLLAKHFIKHPDLYHPPHAHKPPPWWIRGILLITCTGVSFAHGSNDGQKGIGLIMLILIGMLPSMYALNMNYTQEDIARTGNTIGEMEKFFQSKLPTASRPDEYPNLHRPQRHYDWQRVRLTPKPIEPTATSILEHLARLDGAMGDKTNFSELKKERKIAIRTEVLQIRQAIIDYQVAYDAFLTQKEDEFLDQCNKSLVKVTEYAPPWVPLGVALALGIGTMIGWKRIVVTVGEKIGKTHLTYAQGAAAELVAMSTIGLADILGLPVSTTHVLSSGVAGTMAANKSGLQMSTVKHIAAAWVLTLPVCMTLSAILFVGVVSWFLPGTTPPIVAPIAAAP